MADRYGFILLKRREENIMANFCTKCGRNYRIIDELWLDDETGIHRGLKIPSSYGREGSTPSPATIFSRNIKKK